MASYPTHVFIELLKDQSHRIRWLREEVEYGIVGQVFQATNGSPVVIDSSEEFVDENEGRGYLRQLGLDDLIEAVFP